MRKQVQHAEVDLVATLGNSTITLGEILSLKVGDVIPVDIAEEIVASVDSVPVLECKYGILHKQYALKVEKVLTTAESLSGHEEDPHEEDHG
jgi:flagellar motor switch protein FliM